MDIIFKATAVLVENSSLPIILGVIFFKHNSLSPFLTPTITQLEHTLSLQTQNLIPNIVKSQLKQI